MLTNMRYEERRCFELLCKLDTNPVNKGMPTPARLVAQHLAITLQQARKALKKCKELGFIEVYRDAWYDEMDEKWHLLGGYKVTEMGKQTDTYKEGEKWWNKVYKEIWGEEV